MRRRVRILFVFAIPLVGGCVGFAVSVPFTTSKTETTPNYFIYSENALPRKSKNEEIERNDKQRTITYKKIIVLVTSTLS